MRQSIIKKQLWARKSCSSRNTKWSSKLASGYSNCNLFVGITGDSFPGLLQLVQLSFYSTQAAALSTLPLTLQSFWPFNLCNQILHDLLCNTVPKLAAHHLRLACRLLFICGPKFRNQQITAQSIFSMSFTYTYTGWHSRCIFYNSAINNWKKTIYAWYARQK